MKVAVLDDYAGAAESLADWTEVRRRAIVDVFRHNLGDEKAVTEALKDYDVVCTMRERTTFPRSLLARLPKLKLLCFTGDRISGIDIPAASEFGIVICNTESRGVGSSGTAELAWGLILSLARDIPGQSAKLREGGWQDRLGSVLDGKTLGLVGLGRIGEKMAQFGQAFSMKIVAWSQNLTAERARHCGAEFVEKDELFRSADFVSLHLVLSERTRSIVGAAELAAMKPSAYLVNTSRGPLVDEAALLDALRNTRIAGAGLDVFHEEPLPVNSPLRALPNTILTPHLGYSVVERMTDYYVDTVANVLGYLDGRPMRVVNGMA